MRDTLIMLLVAAALAAGTWYAYQQNAQFGPVVGVPAAKSQPVKEDVTRKPVQNRNHHAAVPSEDKASGEQPIYSIYQDNQDSAAQSDGQAPEPAKKKNNFQGLSVDGWMKARRNSIALPPVTADAGGGLRVFLQCMELKKKGPKYLNEKDCDSLVASRPVETTERGTTITR